jgi:hypothetical protein
MNQPVDDNNLPAEPGKRIIDQAELPVQGVTTDNGVCTEVIPGKGQGKRARFRHFEVFCDEPLRLGADDVYLSPMSYRAMREGFSRLTQVARYAHMMRLKGGNGRVQVHFPQFLGGSLIRGTVYNRWDGVDTRLSVECDAPKGKVRARISNAKAGCFAEGLTARMAPLRSTIELNSKPFSS